MIIDTHTHLYAEEFAKDGAAEAVDRALEAGVGHMILPNIDLASISPMMSLHSSRPDVTSMAMGLHPTEIKEGWKEDLEAIGERLFSSPEAWVAVGEIGMDLYWDRTFESQQMKALDEQLGWARKLSLPVIIHCREALEPILEVISGHSGITGVFHSFSGSAADVETIRKKAGDIYFGINGIVTFKKSSLPQSLPEIGLDRILLETDSPYLAPLPVRGRRNESAYIVHTAAAVAAALGKTPLETAEATTGNARALFNLPSLPL